MSIEHTPGPWNVCERWPYQPDGLHIGWENLQHMWIVGIRPGSGIAAIDVTGHENAEANAQLIAAAPDLLAACKAAHEALLTFERLDLLKQDHEQQALDLVRAAIAKAYNQAS